MACFFHVYALAVYALGTPATVVTIVKQGYEKQVAAWLALAGFETAAGSNDWARGADHAIIVRVDCDSFSLNHALLCQERRKVFVINTLIDTKLLGPPVKEGTQDAHKIGRRIWLRGMLNGPTLNRLVRVSPQTGQLPPTVYVPTGRVLPIFFATLGTVEYTSMSRNIYTVNTLRRHKFLLSLGWEAPLPAVFGRTGTPSVIQNERLAESETGNDSEDDEMPDLVDPSDSEEDEDI